MGLYAFKARFLGSVAEVVREAAAYVVAAEHGPQQRRLSRGVPFGHPTLHLRYDDPYERCRLRVIYEKGAPESVGADNCRHE